VRNRQINIYDLEFKEKRTKKQFNKNVNEESNDNKIGFDGNNDGTSGEDSKTNVKNSKIENSNSKSDVRNSKPNDSNSKTNVKNSKTSGNYCKTNGNIVNFGDNHDERCSFVLELPKIRGRFEIEKLDKNFPRAWIRRLTNKEKVEFNGSIFDGREYLGSDEVPPIICVVNSEIDIDDVEDVGVFFCFDYEMFLKICKFRGPDSKVFLVSEGCGVDYRDLYELQKGWNKVCKNFLLPVTRTRKARNSLGINSVEDEFTKVLGDKDYFLFKNNNFDLIRNEFVVENCIENDLVPPYVLFLGTGCALPSKYRNVSAILVVFSKYSLLLDCGEDTYSQILRVYGNLEILDTLKYVFISHSHADHHLGLARILRNCRNRVVVFGPSRISNFLKNFVFFQEEDGNLIFDDSETSIFRNSENFSHGDLDSEIDLRNTKRAVTFVQPGEHFQNNEISLSFCKVDHCNDSYCIKIDAEKTISYSGDTRPDKRFAELSRNVDLMIHEATFADEHVDQAMKTLHSTVSEAKDVFRLAGARQLILTHLSQRYKSHFLIEKDVLMATDFFVYDFRPLDKVDVHKLMEMNGKVILEA
ncbi:tRNAse Z TRZ4, mitochondrial, partial [Dictyocoela roeselum]